MTALASPVTMDVRAITQAHTFDPLPDVVDRPAFDTEWLYLPGQFELALLHRLTREGFAANRFVDYAGNFGQLATRVTFKLTTVPPDGILLRLHGRAELFVDGAVAIIASGNQGGTPVTVPPNAREITVVVSAEPGEAATLGVVREPTPLAPSLNVTPWEASADGRAWEPAHGRRGTSIEPAHAGREATVPMPMQRTGDVFSLPAPVLGRPVLYATGPVTIQSGETPDEARAAGSHETRHDLVQRADGAWTTAHEVGFRYVYVVEGNVTRASAEASVHAAPRRGAFACSDDQLNDIWVTSAYTLRLCMHSLMVDGIKRDRMPWIGDQALNTLSNAYAFADGDIVRDSMVALGQHTSGYVNGIADYSLWWLVNLRTYTLYFDARDHVSHEADRIASFVERLADECGPDGVLRPTVENGAINTVFIDWGADIDQARDSTALQMLWYWGLRSAIDVLSTVQHSSVPRWTRLAHKLRATLLASGRQEDGAFRDYVDDRPSTTSAYPNLLAVLSGLVNEVDDSQGVRRTLTGADHFGTPFMASFALRALAEIGRSDVAVGRIRTLWGQMLARGARTFWEEFDRPDESPFEMYDRPFGKSLCHAWASGPAALLPMIVCGVRPQADAWTRFEVQPSLGELAWAGAVIPVPQGEIRVTATHDETTVEVPSGTTLVRGGLEYAGPQVVRW
ncbi:MAG: hypothetical protein HGA44_01205 [Cellulomonadaceae bacterium]|nr:hypothetical protein [Cellulomonadaceae bacterium]